MVTPKNSKPPRPRHQLSELFAEPDLVDRIFEYVCAEFPEITGKLAAGLKADIRAEFGGREVYIPRETRTARQTRVESVLALFNGRNASEVARRLQMGRASVYRIVKQAGRK